MISMGKAIFVEFVKAVSIDGESYVDYMWQWNDDLTRIVPKLSYVRLFEPWGWVIGTGIYIEDVRIEIRRMEIRALLISGLFGIMILTLLLGISRQSHKIELKRNRAEEELRKSRELYRTLAEAASEGVIIWSRHGLQANKTMLSWIGFTEEELESLLLPDVINAMEITATDNPETLYEELSTRMYLECQLKLKNGRVLNSHADLSRILLGDMKAVMVVVRPVKNLTSQPDLPPPDPLLNYITTGFFRITYGKKPRFIDATKPVMEILGFNDLQELHRQTIESLFADPSQLNEFRHSLAARDNIYGREVLLRKKNGTLFHALVSVIIIETGSEEIWCEGAIEPLAVSAFRPDLPVADPATYGISFIMEAPVTVIMKPYVGCSEFTPVSRVLAMMTENNTRVAVILNKSGEPMGVIDSGSIALRLAEGATAETEAFRWMHSPPDSVREDTSVIKAFGIMRDRKVACLLVIDHSDILTGVITVEELSHAYLMAPQLIYSDIARSASSNTLRTCFLHSRKTAISMLLGHADPWSVSLHISSAADAICRRILEICIDETGEPPCRFAFIQTGSAGRREQSSLTDQDNAIIFENIDGERLNQASNYFLSLGKK